MLPKDSKAEGTKQKAHENQKIFTDLMKKKQAVSFLAP